MFVGWHLQLTASCCNYFKSYVCSLSAKKLFCKEKNSVILQGCLYELSILVASATFKRGLDVFLFYLLFSAYTVYFLLE